jgi:methanogenic corrinoid protein MtbC1
MMSRQSTITDPKHPIQVVARRTGLTADLLRVWEKRYAAVAPGRSPTKRRLYSDADVRRLLLLRRATLGGRRIGQIAGLSTDELEALVASDEAAAAAAPRAPGTSRSRAPRDSHLAACLDAVRSLDADALEAALSGAAVALGTPELTRTVVVPLMQTLGDEWREGKARVFEEHLASAMVRSALGALRVAQTPEPGAPELIVTTPSGQVHELGALMAASMGASQGWKVTYLGPNLPAEEIVAAAERRGARAVALSVVFPADDARLYDELRRLRRLLPDRVTILVGGRASDGLDRIVPEIRLVDDLSTLLDTLEELRRSA